MSHPGPTVDPNCRVASASCPPPRATCYMTLTVIILNVQWRLCSLTSLGPSCPSRPFFHKDYCPYFKTMILAPAWLLAVLVVTGWGTINPII